MRKRELDALLSLSSWCLVIVVWLFLSVPWVCLQFVIMVFPDHTHYFLSSIGFNCWISFALVFSCENCWVICVISFLYLDMFVLGYNASISLGSFMRTKHVCVLINIEITDEVGTINTFKPSCESLLTIPRWWFFYGIFCCFMTV